MAPRGLRQGVTGIPGRIVARPAAIASGPTPPSAPDRTMPSLSIQKWIGSATARQSRAAVPSGRGDGNVIPGLRERCDRGGIVLHVDRDDDEAVSA